MPCEDSSSQVRLEIDGEDRLAGFVFSKMTCSKPIGPETGILPLVAGRPIDGLVSLPLESILDARPEADEDEQFLLFLEWDALVSLTRRYLGRDEDLDDVRYQVRSVEHDADRVVVTGVIRPPRAMPPILACSHGPPSD